MCEITAVNDNAEAVAVLESKRRLGIRTGDYRVYNALTLCEYNVLDILRLCSADVVDVLRGDYPAVGDNRIELHFGVAVIRRRRVAVLVKAIKHLTVDNVSGGVRLGHAYGEHRGVDYILILRQHLGYVGFLH